MVVHKGNGQRRVVLNQGSVQNFGKIVIAALLGGLVHVVVQGDVKQVHFVAFLLEVIVQGFQILFPVFTHGVEVCSPFLADGCQEFPDEFVIDMLDGIQPHAVQIQFPGYPYSPSFHFFHHFRVVEVQIGEHKVVVVAVFFIHAFAPAFAVSHNLENGGFFRACVIVRSGEVVPVPFEVGIFVSAAGKVEAGPAFNLVGVRNFLVAVLLVHFLGHEFFRIVCSRFVVHDGIQINAYMVFMKSLDGLLEFLPGAVFGADGVFLVEFPQVKKIIGAVSYVILFLPCVGWRNPDGRNTHFLQVGGVFLQLVPKLSVVGQIPLKILHHDSVFHLI